MRNDITSRNSALLARPFDDYGFCTHEQEYRINSVPLIEENIQISEHTTTLWHIL